MTTTTLNLPPTAAVLKSPLHRFSISPGFSALVLLFVFSVISFGQSVAGSDEATITIDSAPDMEVISFSKNVVVKREAKGVLVFGGDVIVEGRVEGDVAAIGGSVYQREGSFIGGDVIVVGGKYAPDSNAPLRGEHKETIIFAAYEDELRNLAQNPSQLFAPSFSLAFVAQRLVSVLFWFLISFGFTTIAPGAVGRAVSRINLSSAKVFAAGFFTFVGASILLIAGFTVFPNYINAVLGTMAFVVLILAYVFGRVALHVTFGKLIKKRFFSEHNRSEALTILFGVLFWTVLLSVPYLWTFALLAAFSAGIGLILTARSTTAWNTR